MERVDVRHYRPLPARRLSLNEGEAKFFKLDHDEAVILTGEYISPRGGMVRIPPGSLKTLRVRSNHEGNRYIVGEAEGVRPNNAIGKLQEALEGQGFKIEPDGRPK